MGKQVKLTVNSAIKPQQTITALSATRHCVSLGAIESNELFECLLLCYVRLSFVVYWPVYR